MHPTLTIRRPLSGRFPWWCWTRFDSPALITLTIRYRTGPGAVCGGARSKPKTCKLLSKSNSEPMPKTPVAGNWRGHSVAQLINQGSAIMYTGFFENCSQVIVDGAYTDVQLFGYAQAGKALV